MEIHIVLHEPEIPQNTGNIGRTCMATGARLHLIRPLGFSLQDKYLKRAGLDYWQELDVEIHDNWEMFTNTIPEMPLWFFTTKASRRLDQVNLGDHVFLVFGKETAGIPDALLKKAPGQCLRIPLLGKARSLNLAVAVGIGIYESLRQGGFAGLSESDPQKRLFHAGFPGRLPD